jgi:hypothetical protein
MIAAHRTGGLAWTRRDVLRAGSGCACAALSSQPIASSKATSRFFQGCFITSEGYREYRSQRQAVYSVGDGLIARNRHFRTTGDSALDRDLDRALGVVADLFEVNPAFGFYDPSRFPSGAERNVMNAFATQENTEIAGTGGTVGFGWDLFSREFYNYDNTGMTIIAIMAHEFAHILQGNRGYLQRIRNGYPLRSEINADFLAGYFLGVRKRRIPSLRFQKAGDLFIRLGRSMEGDPTRTHGNSQERLDAAETGFRVAYVENKSVDGAVRASLEYVNA